MHGIILTLNRTHGAHIQFRLIYKLDYTTICIQCLIILTVLLVKSATLPLCKWKKQTTWERPSTRKWHGKQLANAETKARKKLAILRKLAGTNWGAHEKILKSVYLGTIQPILEFGSTAWMTSVKSNQQRLDRVQTQTRLLDQDFSWECVTKN